MGFIDNLLKRYPKQHEWSAISQSIAEGFQNTRQEWYYDVCIKFMQDYVQTLKKPPINLNTELSNEIVWLLKAFQLSDIASFLAAKKYLRISQARSFCDLFWAQVCGAELPAVMNVVEEFRKIHPEMQQFHLGRRVAQHLLGEDKANVLDLSYGRLLVAPFPLANRIAVATAFGDQSTVGTLNKMLDEWFVTGHKNDVDKLVKACEKMGAAA
jgi:hypothetical protein